MSEWSNVFHFDRKSRSAEDLKLVKLEVRIILVDLRVQNNPSVISE